jgi:tRNA pseudouridine13 synthase
VNEENINLYTIYDVVMPVIGYKVKFPNNDIKNIVLGLIDKDGLSVENFKNSTLCYNAVGYYRKILERGFNYKYDILRFDNQDCDLQSYNYNIDQHPTPKQGKNKALRIQFSLPQATYATMLFRELTKQSSSVNFQSQLSEKQKNN